jgi:hypothetical protein
MEWPAKSGRAVVGIPTNMPKDKPVSLRMNTIIFWRGREDRCSKLKPS